LISVHNESILARASIVKREPENSFDLWKKPDYPDTPPDHFSDSPMTVCIGAICHERPFHGDVPLIVTASDQMLAGAFSSSDASTIKNEPVHKDWSVMMAADDFSQCVPIIELARKYFHGRANTLQVARTSFKKAYQQHMAERAADIVLGRYGLDMKTFRKSGKRMFTESKFNALCNAIDDVRGDCDFLIYGFDGMGAPHIFKVKDPGRDEVYDKPGYCAIGSGCYAAGMMLFHLNQTIDCSLRQTIVNVCVAKFMAERVPGVGKATFLYIKKQGSNVVGYAGIDMEEEIRAAWEKEGCPRVPSGIIEKLRSVSITCGLSGTDEWINL
jgi:hypothetical protein